MDFKKTAMGMLAAAVAAAPVVMAQSSTHGGLSGPLFTGIVCGQEQDESDFYTKFINQHGHEYWVGGGGFSDGYNSIGWRMQTANLKPSRWSVAMSLYNQNDGYSGVDTAIFAWFLNDHSGFVGEFIYLDEISNTEPTCVTARSLSNGFTQYNYNARFDPGVGNGTTWGSPIYFLDPGQAGFDFSEYTGDGGGDELSWEDLATAPSVAGHGAIPDIHNTPSYDCTPLETDSNVGS
jgi:hypothetical protein